MSTPTATAPQYLTLADAARLVPTKPHAATLWRWCRRGVKAKSGHRVRLRFVRIGGRVFLPVGALDEFFAAVAAADAAHFETEQEAPALAAAPEPTTRRPSRREREIAEAEARCEMAGI